VSRLVRYGTPLLVCSFWLGACGDDAAPVAPDPGGQPPAAASGAPQAGTGAIDPSNPTAPPVVAPADCAQVQSAPRRLWRLTAVQYDNTIRDLFGIEGSFGGGFPADEVIHGFSNNADSLVVTPLMADKLQSAAQDISSKAELSRLVPCASAGADDNCLRELASKFGERIFRRPLQPTEVERYLSLAKTAGGFEPGARLMLLAFLQSPNFIYRFELGKQAEAGGKRFVLGDYEIASELSFLLWQTTPDDTLLAAARGGQLHEATQVRAQVDRMLASPRAKPVVRAFVFDWLGLSQVLNVPKDMARFPELTAEMRAALLAEAERFVDHVMFDQKGSLSGLLSSPVTFLDAKLAKFYGLASMPDPTQPVMLPEQERRGILTLGATMLAHARSNDSSPVHRGKLVRERLLCQQLPPPPPGLVIEPPPLDPNKTTRERYAAHSSVEPCLTCHRLMDPIGLTFEHFDGIGRYRATDNGLPIDARGEILGSQSSDGKFEGVTQLIDQLDGSPDVARCFSLSWLRFAYGLSESGESLCAVQRMQKELADDAGSLGAIVSVLTQSLSFYERTGDPAGPAQLMPIEVEPEATTPPPAPGATEAQPGLDLQISMSNDWGGGYCKTYQLKNTSAAPINWSVPLMVDGKLNNHWECEVSGDSGTVTFSGAQHNKTLQPGAMAQFGFCGMR
jgi:Protein of unknown function (DUF1592)/Protein of unknown function (DUF1588)/Protein of unknown function (DUF1587)/Protein of unknown function (DUF1595)/Cellulose binding domain/Protein of unknown function (DUF1585)